MNPIILILSILFAIAATVLSFIFIVPEKKKLPGFFNIVRSIFNFKFLVIEKVMQACYIFSTLFVILYGFFGIFFFGYETYEYVPSGSSYWGGGEYVSRWVWQGWVGFLIMILVPIVLRLVYELIMMFLLLVKNVIQINNKLPAEGVSNNSMFSVPSFKANETPVQDAPVQDAPAAAPAKAPSVNNFCSKCGNRLDANGKCANCD